MRRLLVPGLAGRVRRAVAPLRGGGRGWALVSIAAGWLMLFGTRITLPVLLPGIKATFDIDNASAGAAVSVVWGVYALTQFPAGLVGDRIGGRAVVLASLALTTVSVGALAVAPAFPLFLVSAALIGAGNGLFGPTRGTLVSALFPENDSTAIAFTLAVGSIGAAGLPVLAGVAAGRLGWRATILGAVPPFLLVTAVAWRTIPSTDTGGPVGWDSTRDGVHRLATAISRRPVALGVGAKAMRVFVFQGLTAFLPTYLITVKGVDGRVAAGLLSLLFVSGAGAQVVGGRLADGYGDRVVLVAFSGVGALALLALPFTSGLLPLALLGVLAGAQLGVPPVTNAYIIAALPAADRGGAWGLLRTTYYLLASTGAVVVGVLADAGAFDGAFLLLGVLLLVVAAVFGRLPSRDTFE